ncbi:hypothetical protein [Inquilinus sp.]|jgi:hypothetical protein|uniref:hypothetical protein n=1 Tax=Inquilinus sp. TaxID=1932117 RepID=UPI00378361B0
MRFRPTFGWVTAALTALALCPAASAVEINTEQCATLRNGAVAILQLNIVLAKQTQEVRFQNTRISAAGLLLGFSGGPKKDEVVALNEAASGISGATTAIANATQAAEKPTMAMVDLVTAMCPAKP